MEREHPIWRQALRGIVIPALASVLTCALLDYLGPSTRAVLREHLVLLAVTPFCLFFLAVLGWQVYLQYKQ